MTDINKLEELAKAATPGPWTMNAGFLDSRGLFPMFQLFGECDCGSPLGPVTGTHEQAKLTLLTLQPLTRKAYCNSSPNTDAWKRR